MVKNKKGGSKHKKMARKNVQTSYEKLKLVESKSDQEVYGCVTKLFGNGMAEVLCNDEKSRLLIIRGKFSGRNRRDNQISIGTLVLVGLREWELTNKKKLPKVDLLYVYSKNQTEELKSLKNFNKKILPHELQNEEVNFKSAFSNIKNLNIIDEKNEETQNEETQNEKINNEVNPQPNKSFAKLDFDINDI